MSGYLLDTNVQSETVRRVPDAKVLDWLDTRRDQEVYFISVITLGELRRGATLLTRGARRTELEHFIEIGVVKWFGSHVLPVTREIAERLGCAGRRKAACRQTNEHNRWTDRGYCFGTRPHPRHPQRKDFTGLGVPILNPWDQ